MSNLLETTRKNRALEDCKSALREIGCEFCDDVESVEDVAKKIRHELCTNPHAVVNATLQGGPGVKITPIDRKGYKISANSDAVLTHDLTAELTKGTSLYKVLYRIINHMIPKAVQTAIQYPYIISTDVFKAAADGIDYYVNSAFGIKGKGRKAGLHPGEWYLKLSTTAAIEPLYIGLGALVEDIKNDILVEAAHQTDRMIELAFEMHNKIHHGSEWDSTPDYPTLDPDFSFKPNKPHKPDHKPNHKPNHKPGCPLPPVDDDDCGCDFDDDVKFPEDLDPDFSVTPEKPNRPGHHNPNHKPGHHKPHFPEVKFPEDLDPGFGVDAAGPEVNFPENLDPSFSVNPGPDINFSDDLDDDFFVDVDTEFPEIQFPDDLDSGFAVTPDSPVQRPDSYPTPKA